MVVGVRQFGAEALSLDWLVGPILDKELRISSRRRRTYVWRFLYVVVLGVFVVGAWLMEGGAGSGMTAYGVSRMAEVGKAVTTTVVWFQFLMLQLQAVVLLSTSIGDEIQSRTLGVLLTTPITSLQIVMGKLLSRLLQVFVLLGLSFPVLMVVQAFGGMAAGFLVAAYCLTVVTVLFCGTLSLCMSVVGRGRHGTVLATVIWLVVSFVVVFGPLGQALLGAGGIAGYDWLVQVNPYVVMMTLVDEALSPTLMMGGGVAWGHACWAMLGGSALMVLWATWRVRKAALDCLSRTRGASGRMKLGRGKVGPAHRGRLGDASSKIRRVTGRPIVWKELRRPWLERGWHNKLAGGLMVLAVPVSYGLCFYYDAFEDIAVHCVFVGIYVLIGLFRLASEAAGMVAREKQSGTLLLLLTTPIDDDSIVMGKGIAAFRRTSPVWILLMSHLVFFSFTGDVNPMAAICVPLSLSGSVFFVICLGLYCSAKCKRAATATSWTIGILVAIWFMCPLLSLSNPIGHAVYFVATSEDGMRPVALMGAAGFIAPLIYGVVGLLLSSRASALVRQRAFDPVG